MSQEDISLDEKRIYGEKRDTTVAYVATGLGLARVEISGDQVGRVGLVQQGAVQDVAGGDGQLLVATDEDVLVGTEEGFAGTSFGPAVAVGVGGDRLLAADEDGRVAHLAGDQWEGLGTVDEPRRFDGPYLATGDGVVRADEDGLTARGLSDVRDVAAAGPYAATADGLYRWVDGEWTVAREGRASVVAAGDGRVHAVTREGLVAREGEGGRWTACDLPVAEQVADVAYGESPTVVTAAGTVLVDAPSDATPDGTGGWRHRSLGMPDVTAIAIP